MLLQATHLHYAYPEAGREHTVLRDVSLSLQAGEHVALVGSSGSGKSTLLNLLGELMFPPAVKFSSPVSSFRACVSRN